MDGSVGRDAASTGALVIRESATSEVAKIQYVFTAKLQTGT